MDQDSFDTYRGACADHDAKLAAAMEGCVAASPSFEDDQKEHFERLMKEEAYYASEPKPRAKAKFKAETSLEMFRRIGGSKDASSIKSIKRAAKKSVKQKKIQTVNTYFVKK